MSHWSPEEQRKLLLESITEYAIFMLSPDGLIESWNRGGERIFGYTEQQALEKHLDALYAERSEAGTALRDARDRGRSEEEGWRIRKDGSRFWASSVVTAIRGDDGELLGFAKVTCDLSERRASEERARLSETTRSSCSSPTAASPPGTPAPSGSRATAPTRSSASTSRSSTCARTSSPASRRTSCAPPPATATSRTRAGGCARTAPASGPT